MTYQRADTPKPISATQLPNGKVRRLASLPLAASGTVIATAVDSAGGIGTTRSGGMDFMIY